jgi:hypothetical protein
MRSPGGCGGQCRAGTTRSECGRVWEILWGGSGDICRQSIRNTCRDQASSQVLEWLLGSIGYEIRAPEEDFMLPFRRDRSRIPWLSLSSDSHGVHCNPASDVEVRMWVAPAIAYLAFNFNFLLAPRHHIGHCGIDSRSPIGIDAPCLLLEIGWGGIHLLAHGLSNRG